MTSDELPPVGMALGLGLVAVVGLAGSWWLVAHRRDDDRPMPPDTALAAGSGAALAAPSIAPPPGAARRKRAPADWELASALDDAPIGTVEFEGGTDELPPDIEAALDAPVVHAVPGNARTRRMAEMHSWRDETDRRSLLRRVGLPEVDEG